MSTVTQEPTLGELVDAWRIHAGLSKRKLAKLAGCSQPYVVQITNGDRPSVNMVKLVKIARACGWPVEEARGLAADYDPDVHGQASEASFPPADPATPRLLRCFQLSTLGRALAPHPLQFAG